MTTATTASADPVTPGADLDLPLEQAQLDRFQRDGYLPWGRVLDETLLAEARAEYDRLLEESIAGRAWLRDLANDGSTDARRDGRGRVLQLSLSDRSLLFHRLLYHPPILRVLRAVLGPQLQLFHQQAFFKPAGDGAEVFWHQDNGYWRCRPANLVSCWLTLDDADADNGAMQVIPGSHLEPVVHPTSAATKALREVPVDASRAVVVPLPAGACLFHHCQTLHYTGPNRSVRDRRAWAIHVMVPGTTDHRDVARPVDFAHPLLSRR